MGRKLDILELKQLIKSYKDYYRNFHSQCAEEDTYYNSEFKISVAKNQPKILLPLGRIAIDDASIQVDTKNILVHVRPRNPDSAKEREIAETKRKFYLGALNRVATEQGLILHQAVKHCFLYGMSVIGTFYERDLWIDAPDEEDYEDRRTWEKGIAEWSRTSYFPLSLKVYNPQSVMPDPLGRCVIIATKKKGADIALKYPEFNQYLSPEAQQSNIDWVEYWDDEYYIKLGGNEWIVEEGEHGYGFNPFIVIDAGLGYLDANASPEQRYRGLLHGSHSLLKGMSRAVSQAEAIMRQFAWPQERITGEERAASLYMRQAKAGPGTDVYVPEGISIETTDPKAPPQELLQLLSYMDSVYSQATVSKVIQGIRPTGAASGYMTAVLAGMAAAKFGPVLFAMERAIEKVNEHFGMLVERIVDAPVTVWAQTPAESIDEVIKPSDFNGYYANTVKLSRVAPEEESRKAHDGAFLYQTGLISAEFWAERYGGVPNYSEVRKQIIKERILMSPPVMEAIIQALLQSQEMAQEAEAIAGGPVNIGNQGQPPSPALGGGVTSPRSRLTRPVMPGSIEEQQQTSRQIKQGGVPMTQRPGMGGRL